MAKIVKAPGTYNNDAQFTIFLAGSIDMGSAEDWQTKLSSELSDENVLLLNPRRDDWDSSWKQSIDDPQFRQQVEWELKGQEDADLIVYYFADGSQSPITLLELGLGLGSNAPVLIYCTDKYFRKGNIDVTAKYYGQEVVTDWDTFVLKIREQCDNF
jgi:hypothetical protein